MVRKILTREYEEALAVLDDVARCARPNAGGGRDRAWTLSAEQMAAIRAVLARARGEEE